MLNKIKKALSWRVNYYTNKCNSIVFSKVTFIVDFIFTQYLFLSWQLNYKKESLLRNKTRKPKLFWGIAPILNNKYWSQAMKQIGYDSTTVMETVYAINKKEDYDIYLEDILKNLKGWKRNFLLFSRSHQTKMLLAFDYLIKNYDIVHIPFSGSFLGTTKYAQKEAELLKKFGIKIIALPYGSDAYIYSMLKDTSLQHALLLSYPNGGKISSIVQDRLNYWAKNVDCIAVGFQNEMPRWDLLAVNFISIDSVYWQKKVSYSENNGINGIVTIIHTPNHKGFKGTEFIIKAIQELKEENLLINFILVEKIPNSEVKRIMYEEADILTEQLIAPAYALSAIEGMVSGLPVMANLHSEVYTRHLRRYAYLNECPILSTTPETIKDNLRILIKNPQLREELGRAGRKYVEKYHSYQTSQYMFGKIYDKIWYEKEVDLMNMFHPLMPDSYNNQSPKIEHPLVENKIPAALLATLNT